MRIKFFPTISMLLLSAIAMTSCLKSDNQNYEIIPDATIHGFQIDTIPGGIQHDFSIDQARGLIYNIDSLPMYADTVVNKILIQQIITSGAAVYHNEELMNYQDSVDLSKPFELVTRSIIDPTYTKKYIVEVRVHKLDPDRIDWKSIVANLPVATSNQAKKIICFNGKIFIYIANNVYSINDYKDASWEQNAISGIEFTDPDLAITDFVTSRNYIFAIYNNQVYHTEDGVNWNLLTTSNNIKKLLATHDNSLYAISTDDNYCAINFDTPENGWKEGSIIATDFPEASITSAIYERSDLATILGESSQDKSSRTAWMTEDGLTWFKLVNSSEDKFHCPFLKNPILLGYDKILYAIGEETVTSTIEKEKEDGTKEEETITKQLNRIYTSTDGINWESAKAKEQFGEDLMEGKIIESASVDANNYIWLTIKGEPNIWRGRLNRLGFLQRM